MMYVDKENANIKMDLRKNGVYDFPLTLQVLEHVRSHDIVLNIGANIGYFAIVAATKAKKVFAFEPDPTNFSFLQRNSRSNIITIQTAVGNHNETTTFWIDSVDHENSSLAQASTNNGTPVSVPCTTIDSFLSSQNIIPTIIIMDIQGAEMLAFEGMQRTLQKHPILFLEVWPYGLDRLNASVEDLYSMLKAYGYRLHALGSDLPDADSDWSGLIRKLRSTKDGRGFCNLIAISQK